MDKSEAVGTGGVGERLDAGRDDLPVMAGKNVDGFGWRGQRVVPRVFDEKSGNIVVLDVVTASGESQVLGLDVGGALREDLSIDSRFLGGEEGAVSHLRARLLDDDGC